MHSAPGTLRRMAFTTSDLDAIKGAIASGELTVRTADGKQVTLRTMAELLQAKAAIEAEIAGAAGGTPRLYPRHQLADFSD